MTRLSSWSCKWTWWRRASEWWDSSFPKVAIAFSKESICYGAKLAQFARTTSVLTAAKRRETPASTWEPFSQRTQLA